MAADAEIAHGKELLRTTGVDPKDGAGLKRSLHWFKRLVNILILKVFESLGLNFTNVGYILHFEYQPLVPTLVVS